MAKKSTRKQMIYSPLNSLQIPYQTSCQQATVFVRIVAHCAWAQKEKQSNQSRRTAIQRIPAETMTGDTFWRAAVLRSNRKYGNDVVGDGERDFGCFFSKYIQDNAWITLENAETRCTGRVWSIWKVGFAMSLVFLAPNAKFTYYCPPRKCYLRHQNDIEKQGCATIRACTTIRTNTVALSPQYNNCYLRAFIRETRKLAQVNEGPSAPPQVDPSAPETPKNN